MGLQSVGCGWRAASVVGRARPPSCLPTGVPGPLRPAPPPSPLPAFPGQVLAEAELPQHVGGREGWGHSPLLAHPSSIPARMPAAITPIQARLSHGASLTCMYTQPTPGCELKCPWRHNCIPRHGYSTPSPPRPSGGGCSRSHCLLSLAQSPTLPPASGQRVLGIQTAQGARGGLLVLGVVT